MGFDEQAVDSDRNSGAGNRENKLRLAVTRILPRPGELNRMRRVQNHGVPGVAHDAQRSHIDDKIVITEAGAALGQHDVLVPGRLHLFRLMAHVLGSHELPFFDIDRFAGPAGCAQNFCLAAEEGGNLQNIGYLGDRGRFPVGMDVSQDGDTEFFLNLRENCEGSLHLQSHECQIACPIGFPVGRLEDERHPELVRDILNALGGLEGHRASFDDAGTGDEDNRIPPSDSDLADSYHADFRGCRSLLTPPKYKKM